MRKKRVAVLISGRGSNLQSLIDAAQNPAYPAEISLVISNVPGVYGLERAKKAAIPLGVIDHKKFPTREAFEDALLAEIDEMDIDIVCLAGFMRVLTPHFITPWAGKLLNIHPSLLPEFKGLHTHRRALESGVTEHGCTVHLVTPDLDDGPILAQARVPVLPGDTEETLAARVLEQEHVLYPAALAELALLI